nr:MAG TPA: hypothetical protein [Caudoviricetes sp.]
MSGSAATRIARTTAWRSVLTRGERRVGVG